MQKLKNYSRGAAAVVATIVLAGAAQAAGTNAGVEAGFFELGTDLTTILEGSGGFLILIASVLIAAGAVAFTGRWTLAIAAFGVALILGYGVNTLSGFAGVTAGVDMVALEVPVVEQTTVE